MKIKQLLYLPWWYFQIRFLNKQIPLQTVIFISNICNYDCRHCCVDKSTPTSLSYEKIKTLLENSYKKGSRYVDFEGGEPTLWQDGEKNINDLCELAKSIGFFSTTVTTNASMDFSYLNADHIFVSLDGTTCHDKIRGPRAFKRLEENIAKFPDSKKISVNMVINSINKNEVIETLKYAENNPNINGISFNFYNNFNGDETLSVNEKENIIAKLILYKKQGYNIINTTKGLSYLANPHFERVCWMTNFINLDGKDYLGCHNSTQEICDNCGFGMAGEMRALYDFSPETILAGLNLRKPVIQNTNPKTETN